MNSINTILMIGGFVVLFCVLISILNNSGFMEFIYNILSPIFNLFSIDANYIKPIFSGLIELTNGIDKISVIPTKSLSITIIITSFLLGCGGLSILLQVLSITSKSDISIKPYIIGKLLHGVISAILTYFAINLFPVFNLDITPILSPDTTRLSTTYNYSLVVLAIILIFVFLLFNKRKKISTHIS